ncbi:hypothetical protein C8Q70DRAFT_124378 [Cubamyces menziesii]|nr:hypothetical protein C8Q70DRAFT_124378 [Cubamyces menziesii]
MSQAEDSEALPLNIDSLAELLLSENPLPSSVQALSPALMSYSRQIIGGDDARPAWIRILDVLDRHFESVESTGHAIPEVLFGAHSSVSRQRLAARYALYQDCLRYFQVNGGDCSVSMAVCSSSLRSTFETKTLNMLPQCFGTLVNCMVDNLFQGSMEPKSALCSIAAAMISNLGDAVYSVIAATRTQRYGPCLHISCQYLRTTTPSTATANLDQYRGVLLDFITGYLCELLNQRQELPSSLMPWSRTSMQELSLPAELVFGNIPYGRGCLLDLQDNRVRDTMSKFGPLRDIPWLGAEHDDFPLCPNLSTYIAIRRQKLNTPSLECDAALWLSSMTFGLVEAILHTKIAESVLLAPGMYDGKTVVSGARVVQLLSWSTTLIRQQSSIGEASHWQTTGRLLRRAIKALDEELKARRGVLCYAGLSDDESRDLRYALTHFVYVLCEFLRSVAGGSHQKTLPDLSEWPAPHISPESYQWWKARMLDVGWCPYLLSSLGRTPNSFRLTHITISISLSLSPYFDRSLGHHTRCLEDSCTYWASSNKYTPRHDSDLCSCKYLKPSLDVILRFLSRGTLPALRYDGSTLSIMPARQVPYVAISHAWVFSEGLGSTTEVGLPLCVVKRIAGLTRALLPGTGGFFWMDSLCIPESDDERRCALKLRAQAYRHATKVLVIDSSIRTLCSTRRPMLENLVRIAASAWARPIRTLQEAVLSDKLFFEFVEGPVTITQADVGGSSHLEHLLPFLATPSRHVPGISGLDPEYLTRIMQLLQGRARRSVEGIAIDEFIALSSVLPVPLDVAEMLVERDGPDAVERRMRSFLVQLRTIPKFIPFGDGPRLGLSGFSWAPLDLLQELPPMWNMTSGSGVCTRDGLHAEYYLVHLERSLLYHRRPYSIIRHWTSPDVNFILKPVDDDHMVLANPLNSLVFMLPGAPRLSQKGALPVLGVTTNLRLGYSSHGTEWGSSPLSPHSAKYAGRFWIQPCGALPEGTWTSDAVDFVRILGDPHKTWVKLT